MADEAPDYSAKYNTVLDPAAEARFQAWAKASGRDQDTYDYDLRGWWQRNGRIGSGGHLTDQFKKPNHPTFSSESQYSGIGGNTGGQWRQQADGSWAFAASPTNLKMLSPKALNRYFDQVEKGNKLILPPGYADGGAIGTQMADPTYIPTTGDLSSYGAGPEHQFFLWDAAAQAAGTPSAQAPGSVPTPTPRPAGISAAPTADRGDGSEYGADARGLAMRDRDLMRSGTAPFTARGIGQAIGNAFSIGSFANPVGAVLQAGMRAARAGIGGQPVGAAMSPVQDVYGHTAFDTDLMDAVGAQRMTRAQAVGVQAQRNRDQGREGWGGNSSRGSESYGHAAESGPAGRGSGQPRGGYAADGGRVGYQGGGGVHEPMMQRPAMRRPGTTFVSRIPRGIGPMDGGVGRAPFGLDPRSGLNPMYADGGNVGEHGDLRDPRALRAQIEDVRRQLAELPLDRYPGHDVSQTLRNKVIVGRRMAHNRGRYADGGGVGISGAVDSPTPGRDDAVDASAPDGAYVIPADVVSALGDGNSDAGHAIIDQAIQGLMAQSGGGGQGAMPGQMGQNPGMARGGSVPIRVSGGEHIVHPHAVMAYGRGSHRHGAAKLDAMIRQIRERTATKLRGLPRPR